MDTQSTQTELMERLGTRPTEVAHQLACCIFEALQEATGVAHPPMEKALLMDATIAAVNKISDQLGGANVYFPNRKLRGQKAIRLQIKQEFTGNNHVELCRRYGLSTTTIRRILIATDCSQ